MMIRLLVLIVLTYILAGCISAPPHNEDSGSASLVIESQSLDDWLLVSRETNSLSPQEAHDELLKLSKSQQGGLSLFYFGALNQQLQAYDGWVQARDAFRSLVQSGELGPNFRELARLRMVHNQDLINWYERHRHLQKELAESILDREQLEEKIAALAELEAAMSNRKQQNNLSPLPDSESTIDTHDDKVQQ